MFRIIKNVMPILQKTLPKRMVQQENAFIIIQAKQLSNSGDNKYKNK